MSRSVKRQGSVGRMFVLLVAVAMIGYWFVPSLAHASGGGSDPAPTLPIEQDEAQVTTSPSATVTPAGAGTPVVVTSTPTETTTPTTVSGSGSVGSTADGGSSISTETPTPTATPIIVETSTPTSSSGEVADVVSIITVIPKPDCDCPLLSRMVTPTPDPSTPTPTKKPTATPTKKPTATPTKKPSPTPTKKPTGTGIPTPTPTKKPTATPTKKPTATPTKKPTATPTKKPTATPTPVYEYYYDPDCVAEHEASQKSGSNNQGEDVLGAYSCTPLSSVSGWLFKDSNSNGKKDTAETAYSGVRVELWKTVQQGEVLEAAVQTNVQGYWQAELSPGEYRTHFAAETFPAGVTIPQSDQKIIVTDDLGFAGTKKDLATQLNGLFKNVPLSVAILLAIPFLIAVVAGAALWGMRRKLKVDTVEK